VPDQAIALVDLVPGDVVRLADGSLAVYLEDELPDRVRVLAQGPPGESFAGRPSSRPHADVVAVEYRIGPGDEVVVDGTQRARVESVSNTVPWDERLAAKIDYGYPPMYEVTRWLAEGRWADHVIRRSAGRLVRAERVDPLAVLKVGDFVVIRGRGERLGRIERVEAGWYQVRSLMAHRRWAMHTSQRRPEELELAAHDQVRAKLGLEVDSNPGGALATATGLALVPSPTMATKSLPRRRLLQRPSPATERSLAARVLAPAAVDPPAAAVAGALVRPAVPPMPPGELTAEFATVAYGKPFRRYQLLALDAFEKARAAGGRHAYIVMPPGSGKTVLGLEIARRLGNRALCLGPNTAIQAQWIEQWRGFQPATISAGIDPTLDNVVTALTYQAICNIDPHSPELDEQVAALQAIDTGDRYISADIRRHTRLVAAQGGAHEQLLALLHPNGRRLLEKLTSGGQWTLVLDECHHLLEMWGYLLRSLLHELGDDVFVIGLTATPASELNERQAALQQELFGRADFEVATPAVVKEGNLAPYQELAYLTTPLDHEAEYIESERLRFEELITALLDPGLGTVSFLDWFQSRFVERRSREGVEVGWDDFEARQPNLAQAALRYCYGYSRPPPPGARLREGDREPPTAEDWIYLIDDYCVGHLRGSEAPADLAGWEMIHAALPGLGYALGYRGVHSYISPVDRVLLLSGGKAVAATEILATEDRALGPRLRALLICDFEVAGAERPAGLEGVLDPQAGSAALILKTLLADTTARELNPILVTGRTVACSRATAADLAAWIAPGIEVVALEGQPRPGGEDAFELRPKLGSWEPRDYLAKVTRYFEEGRSRCLIGTRGLLGEGWDACSVNVLIDLTGVTTTTSVHQLRGRSLRLDPEIPRKVSDNWDVVCIAPGHPMGLTDYSRFVRKHRNYFGLTETGEIESGVSHVDARFSPFGPPPADQVAELNTHLLGQPEAREEVYARWGVGQPYQNLPTETVRIHFGRSPGLTPGALRTAAAGVPPPPSFMAMLVATLLVGIGITAVGLVTGRDFLGLGLGLLAILLGLVWTGRKVRTYLGQVGPAGTLENLAAAVAEGLAAAGVVESTISAASLRVVAQPDGYYRCYLEGASLEDSGAFAAAMEELLGPIQEPRYIIPRYIARAPSSTLGALLLLVRRSARRRRGDAVVYHAVPAALALNRERAALFAAAWNRHVSPGDPLFEKDPQAAAVIELQRGEDPFDVLTQMRTLWE
jgi:superfamily II DNA or RNA helicase